MKTERCSSSADAATDRHPLRAWHRFAVLLLLVLPVAGCRKVLDDEGSNASQTRIVSLSPALTETLVALGLSQHLVAISDYCAPPASHTDLPRVGTVFTPRYEAIVAANPTVIVAELIDGTRASELQKLASTLTYRWLSYADVLVSTREVGRRFGRERVAADLVANYETALAVPAASARPRVLLAMAHVPGQLAEVWFIRHNSLHGRVLEAAGAQNAVDGDVVGPPRVGLERVLALDPDAVIVLDASNEPHPELLDDWRRLSGLRAVREGRIASVTAPEAQVPGPRIVRLVERLRRALSDVGLVRTSSSSSETNGSAGFRRLPRSQVSHDGD